MPVRISLVTPSYNQARFIDETLRSVISQRQQVHEYFVLDGGSTDGSVDTIKEYAGFLDYWTSAKDAGQSDAIHRGFSRATGDVLGWLNSDDVLLPNSLAAVQEAFERHPDWDVLTGYHVRINEDSKIVSLHRSPKESGLKARFGIMRVCQQACFFRRSLYELIGGLRLDLHCVMDTELWIRMCIAGARWGHIPQYLAGYRWHSQAKMLGTAWAQRAGEERANLRLEHPDYSDSGIAHACGLTVYRMGELLSGRYFAARRDTRRLAGQRLVDVFGDWIAPA